MRLASENFAMSENATASARSLREQTSEEIRALMGRRNINASELARRIGATQPYISRRLGGHIAFDLDDLEKISRVLQVEVAELLPRPAHGRTIATGGQDRPKGDTAYYPTPTNGRPGRSIPRPRDTRPAPRGDEPTVPLSARRPARLRSTGRPTTA